MIRNKPNMVATLWADALIRDLPTDEPQPGEPIPGPEPTDRMDYETFCRELFPHYFKLAPSKMHRDFIDEMTSFHETRAQKRWFLAPADSAKTTHWSKLYPLYCIAYSLEPFILLASNIGNQSERNLESIKQELEGNFALRQAFPHIAGQGIVWNVSEIVTRNGIKISTAGRGKSIRGATFGSSRPTLIIADDLDDKQEVATQESRDKSWEWFTGTLIPRGASGHANVVIIDTMKHVDDIVGRCGKAPGWIGQRYRSIISWPTRKDLWSEWATIFRQQTIDKNERLIPRDANPAREFYDANQEEMDAGAVVLWPEKEPLYALMIYIQELGERSFATEKQGEAKRQDDAEWPEECFDESVILFHQWPTGGSRFVMACDPSKGRTARSDPSAWIWGMRGDDGLIYIDADIKRRDAEDICRDGIKLAKEFQPMAVGCELDSYGAVGSLWTVLGREERFEGQPPMLTLNSQENKTQRIRNALTRPIRAYEIRMRANSVGVGILLQQLKAFPRASEHDDGPDALEMFFRLLNAYCAGELVWEDSSPTFVQL